MKKKLVIGIAIGAVLLFIVISFIGSYNQIILKDENVKGKWANVETQYQRRLDLIPNIVRTVKGYAEFEKSTLTSVIEARSKATSPTLKVDPEKLSPENIQRFQQAQGRLGGALSRLLVTIERYPNLKAEKGFGDLRAQLEGTENRITVARNDFNTVVKDYNLHIRKFPTRLIASMFGFERKGYFEADNRAEEAPKVEF